MEHGPKAKDPAAALRGRVPYLVPSLYPDLFGARAQGRLQREPSHRAASIDRPGLFRYPAQQARGAKLALDLGAAGRAQQVLDSLLHAHVVTLLLGGTSRSPFSALST